MASLLSSILLAASAAATCAPCAAQNIGDGQVATLTVTATVDSACDISGGPSGLIPDASGDFGLHDALDLQIRTETRLTVTTHLSIRCTADVTPTVVFDFGRNPDGMQRRLLGPSNAMIPYELRRGAAGAPLWDDRPYPVSLIPGRIDKLLIFGKILSLPSDLPDALYTDEVYVTLRY